MVTMLRSSCREPENERKKKKNEKAHELTSVLGQHHSNGTPDTVSVINTIAVSLV